MRGVSSDRVVGPLALVGCATLGIMLGYEAAKELLVPGLGKWQSHAVTIVFTATLVTVTSYFVLNYRRTLHRRSVDETVKRSEANLRTAQELAHLGSFEISFPPSSNDHWSDEMYRIVGVDPSRGPLSLEAFAEELVYPEDRARFAVNVQGTLREGAPFDFSFRLERGNGSVRYVQSVGRPVHDESGRVVKAIGSLLDVTARVRAEEELRRTEARARAFLESVGETVVAIDRSGRIVFVNDRVVTMFGYGRGEVLGQGLEMLLPERLRAGHADHRRNYFASPRLRPMGQGLTLTGCRKDGTEFPIEVSLSFVEAEEGALAMSSISDITERKRAEGALEEAQRAAQQRQRLADIGALTAKIVHDLGNPLAGLSMSAQQIARRIARNPSEELASVRAPIEHMVATVRRLDALTQEFKTFLRDQRLNVGDIDLKAFLGDLVSVWQPEARTRGIKITLEASDDGDPMRGDADQLRRLFDNLVKNALEAIGRGPGHVRIATAVTHGDKIRIIVEDTGPGIPESTNVFGLFETTKVEGTGLGLPIANQIAVAHGGGIEFASVEPHGTVFTVELPRNGPTL